jgi:tetratricopeptide (TPR) repeat protein
VHPNQNDISIAQKRFALYLKAKSLEASDPVGAAAQLAEVVKEDPGNRMANRDLGDMVLKITGKAAEAVPYYGKALFSSDGSLTPQVAHYFNYTQIFEDAGDLPTAKKLYNRAVYQDNFEFVSQGCPLPQLTGSSSSLDLACYTHIGCVLESGYGTKTHDARAHLETALNIKDCDVSRFYLGWFQHEYPAAWAREMKNNPPTPEFQKKFDQAKFTYMAKRLQR